MPRRCGWRRHRPLIGADDFDEEDEEEGAPADGQVLTAIAAAGPRPPRPPPVLEHKEEEAEEEAAEEAAGPDACIEAMAAFVSESREWALSVQARRYTPRCIRTKACTCSHLCPHLLFTPAGLPRRTLPLVRGHGREQARVDGAAPAAGRAADLNLAT